MGSIFDLSFAVPTVVPRYSSGREKQQKDLAVDKHFFSDSLPRVIKALPEKGGLLLTQALIRFIIAIYSIKK